MTNSRPNFGGQPSAMRCSHFGGPVSDTLGFCVECLRRRPAEALPHVARLHAASRRQFRLPVEPPQDPEGVRCPMCANECRMAEGQRGYCGLRANRYGKLVHLSGTAKGGLLHWYYDPLPTNCVADWVCAGSRQRGKRNLAAFYAACTFNCLFCQNWHYRDRRGASVLTAQELAAQADRDTFCICFFGGDPTPQFPHALATARLIAGRVAVCWETNGSMHPTLLKRAIELSLASGGCIKFDLKAFDEGLHQALTGTSNRRTLENFATAAGYIPQRRGLPLLVASTLLVPGYVDAVEVGCIARFIAQLDPTIPYALLAFAPNFYLSDLPCTSVKHAQQCWQAAQEAGLSNVRVGNRHLLSHDY